MWNRNLDQALALRPEHLSFYLLEVHTGTPLAEHINRGLQPAPDEDLAAVMYERMLEEATVDGYQHYEISNLCMPGFESRHNSKYWTRQPYIGFGCSAHSYDGDRLRWSNERDLQKYLGLVESSLSPVCARESLTEEELRAEALFLGLRMMGGISAREFRDAYNLDVLQHHREDFTRFREAGLLEINGDTIKLTSSGALLSNEVFSAFV
jgi:oxygen-independent coproporphyrinogen-3 oxidase